MKIVFYKLANGDDIIATLEDEIDEAYVVSNPLKLVVEPTKPAYAMVAWFPYCDAEYIEVKKRIVIASIEPSEYLRDIYVENVNAILKMEKVKKTYRDSPELLTEEETPKRILH